MNKTGGGNFFEDFRFGQTIVHATPRSVSAGDQALYTALYGTRFALHSSDGFARDLGLPSAPVDDLLAFHLVFGKTVPDISLNAVANLGYADCRFADPVYPGDDLRAVSEVIGLKENSNGKTGVVTVRSRGTKADGALVVEFIRWVMVLKRDPASPAPVPVAANLPARVAAGDLRVPQGLKAEGYDTALAGSSHCWDDYAVGEKIDHIDGMTLEEAEHQLATRLYQNTAKVHFDNRAAASSRFGRRIVYGGHIISLARALSFNGLANAFKLVAINGGTHSAPSFAGDTIYAWSEVLEKIALPGRDDIGALRLRTLACKDRPCETFPDRDENGGRDPSVVLDLDYTVLMPRSP